MVDEATSGTFFDRVVDFPLQVAEHNTALLGFDVPVEAARRWVPGGYFELTEVMPGVARMVVSACDYRRTDWASSRSLTFGFLVSRAGTAADGIGLLVHRMPVNEPLSCALGRGIMDFPVSIEIIKVDYVPDEVTFQLAIGVHPTLELRIPRVPPQKAARRIDLTSYSYRDGVPYAMTVAMDLPRGEVSDPRTVGVTLGNGPFADELRGLGLTSPESCLWGEGLTATISGGRPLEARASTD